MCTLCNNNDVFLPLWVFRTSTTITMKLYELCSFSNLSITSSTSQLILQPFRRFTYITAHSPTLPLLHLRHSSFSNPSLASPTSQALHLIHLASRPWWIQVCLLLRMYWAQLEEEEWWLALLSDRKSRYRYIFIGILSSQSECTRWFKENSPSIHWLGSN